MAWNLFWYKVAWGLGTAFCIGAVGAAFVFIAVLYFFFLGTTRAGNDRK